MDADTAIPQGPRQKLVVSSLKHWTERQRSREMEAIASEPTNLAGYQEYH